MPTEKQSNDHNNTDEFTPEEEIETVPHEITALHGNWGFRTGRITTEGFLKADTIGDDSAIGRLSIGYSQKTGRVSIAIGTTADDFETGALVNVDPDEAREAAKTLRYLANCAEMEPEGNERTENSQGVLKSAIEALWGNDR